MLSFFSRMRLGSKFLLMTVPAVVVSALLFALASYVGRVSEREAINRDLSTQQAKAHASLLSYPIWNLDQQTVEAILASLPNLPRVRCASIDPVMGGVDR